jgi:hypothetical protein
VHARDLAEVAFAKDVAGSISSPNPVAPGGSVSAPVGPVGWLKRLSLQSLSLVVDYNVRYHWGRLRMMVLRWVTSAPYVAVLQCCCVAVLQCCSAAVLQFCAGLQVLRMLQCCSAAVLQCCSSALGYKCSVCCSAAVLQCYSAALSDKCSVCCSVTVLQCCYVTALQLFLLQLRAFRVGTFDQIACCRCCLRMWHVNPGPFVCGA